ncbi:MucR family transcriptional regulator [Tranquillimonas alkanivorans]|uniref:ROS/MUCR transcriptional regulator protein n=1 Tax=Tranquillimonas alkanivorans TaxID=441119 RepID=A0A1I5S5H9_9RHOB|nr:MucR family transcriptional regulator [Tranquillimonas alkanivorans]SFP66043.1 ROS/MUCR transcriptional regulator protein [Tranquillimonas alkanivorans]
MVRRASPQTGSLRPLFPGRLRAWLGRRKTEAPPVPAVPIEESVHRSFLVCLETGTRLVLLRRHLQERLRMTPEEYRAKWGLPPEYPMVAAAYRQRRGQVVPGEGTKD